MNRTSGARSSLLGLTGLSLLMAALPFAAGCAGSPDGTDGASNVTDPLNGTFGVDYSWARPSPSQLRSDGYTFAARYLSYDASKNISAGEAHALEQAGLDVVANWEQGGSDALDGYGRGVEHAKAAEAEAAAAGMPAGRPIYFSCDFDASPAQQGAINAYMDGVASVIGRERTGAYGGFYLIQRLFDDGKIAWGWQTYAWSGGQWDGRAQLRQVQNGVEGGSCDRDQAVASDYGQWGAQSPPPPPPQGPPTAVPTEPSGCGTIEPGRGLAEGHAFSSCDGRFSLAMQTDGNLVLYHNGAGALWSTRTNGTDGFAAVMQGDGNFVLYGKHSNALWASGTDGHGGAKLVVQDDGNLVVYGPGGKALWASNTVVAPPPPPPPSCTIMSPGQGLTAGQQLSSCDGRHTLAMQGDGNLVLYHNGVAALWATGTNGKGGYTAVMQGDGNFVLYNAASHPLWASNTSGHGGSYLAVQNDGNLVVYAPGGAPLWNTRTNGK